MEDGIEYKSAYASWLAGWLRNHGCAGETLGDGSKYWNYMIDNQLNDGVTASGQ